MQLFDKPKNKHLQSLHQVAHTPVAGFNLWEIIAAAAVGVGGYFAYEHYKGNVDDSKANTAAGQAQNDPNTQIATILYSAMVPGYGPTDTTTVLQQAGKINDFAAVSSRYAVLYPGRNLSNDLAKYLSAADLQTFMQIISGTNTNDGQGIAPTDEAGKIHALLNPLDFTNLLAWAQRIGTAAGSGHGAEAFDLIKKEYQTKYGVDLNHDLVYALTTDQLDQFDSAINND